MDHLVSLSLCLTVFCVSLAHNYHAFLFLLPVLALALSGYQFIFNYPFLFICSLFWHKFFPPFPCVAPRRRWLRSPSVQFRSVHLFIPLICRLFLLSLLYCGVLFFFCILRFSFLCYLVCSLILLSLLSSLNPSLFFPFHLTFMIEFPDAFRLFSPFHISFFSCLSLPLQSFLLLMTLFPFSFLPLHSKQASSPHS